MKTLTFFSNYFNHHQKALCDAFYSILKEGFVFVETMPMEEFRTSMGWGEDIPSYVLRTYESSGNEERAKQLALTSDLVIMGTAPEYYIKPRIEKDLIVFRYSERPLKEGFIKFFIPRLTKKYINLHVSNRKKRVYILAASAFASWDFKKMFNSYPDKCYKFAYFPKHLSYDFEDLYERKLEKSRDAGATVILWEGRMIGLKRADLLIKAAAALYKKGYDLRLRLVGDGDKKESLIKLSEELGIGSITEFTGFLSPDEARKRMADAEVYVMTSNRLEGWGSVIYEAENAGCAVIASDACGATPWLVKPGRTGHVFRSGNVNSLEEKLEMFLKDKKLRHDLGKNAYEQMRDEWNPAVAATRTIELFEALEKGADTPFDEGPLSKADIIRSGWYRER